MQLSVENLSKNYRGGVQALRNVQLSLKPGVLGLLGPNGAGKSTCANGAIGRRCWMASQ
jgi:ABC-2 type transport system ATP-binding protein